ncbi:orotidine 5-phosphate decarboxylase [Sulfitobacter aestuariivivens]|uniref:Orotidine 5-phosphate decarboxylase n=1 Tax=Sulfitobacter aestuariivivens TaxID=2766981 RepID=A0A927D8Z1_9RHOB|nr:orotidine 5-phosphate decarboxylase [Sulfitobacter aestuariivivens]MBD3665807.1 orotidine 5-phosphate decarboxylase [Sulfitobacter aestuariivivens]
MQTQQIQLTDVIYNAANQSFEALVTIYDGDVSRKYPCAINAPIDMSFEAAASGLTTQALRRHQTRTGIYSEITRHVPAQRAGRRGFDPMRWLESLVQLPGRRAA